MFDVVNQINFNVTYHFEHLIGASPRVGDGFFSKNIIRVCYNGYTYGYRSI